MFKRVNPKINFPELEEEILTYWKKNKIFEKSISSRPEDKKWNFVDGPPFITGLPHYGTLLASIPKDIFPRFWTMRGYRVRRVWGWDVHGLPAENKVENKLGLKSKRDIEEKVGIAKFIQECKNYVSESSAEWEWYVDHIARWVDFTHAYKTMDLSYMETVMWVFKQMYDKGYIYKGLRVSLYCPHCVTPISNFEVAMDQDNYKEVTEAANTYKYQLKDERDTFLLAWSTTPWNKIVTPALAVNPKLDYVKVVQGSEKYILAKSTITMLKGDYTVLETFKGKDLIGKSFIPHYDFYKIEKGKKAFIVIGGDFVTADEGTGIVTIAAYGEEDMKAMKEYNISVYLQLDEEGNVKKEIPKFGGMYYLKANHVVNHDLFERGLVYDEESITHKVPTCWRCHTRLYYAPIDAWFVDIQQLKPRLKKNNEPVNWFPEHFKYGRFLKSLEAAPDWNISRNRYWGSPVPVWECRKCGERIVPGSIAELEKLSHRKITDLHKPGIDEVTINCPKCGEKAHRVAEVLDSWIEAGSAPYAERHFPFDKKIKLEDFFPPDFIVEYTGQIRAWFYVLHVIGTALFDSNAFKNVVVTGVILGTDGRKMSKNFGNYPDPKEMLQKYGGDALRLYLMDSPVMHGEDIIISEEQYRNQVRGYLLVLWNIYNFFVTYANIDNWKPQNDKSANLQSKNVLDEWVLSLLQVLINDVTKSLEKYDTMATIDHLKKFVEDFSTWYIRRSRDRVGPSAEDEEDKEAFYQTAYYVLTTFMQVSAPITPFISEEIYKGLTGEESVHLTYWPQEQQELRNKNQELLTDMIRAREAVESGHAIRKNLNIKVRQPLYASIRFTGDKVYNLGLKQLITEELNLKLLPDNREHDSIEVGDYEQTIYLRIYKNIDDALKAEGEARDIIRRIQEERKKLGTSMAEKVNVVLPEWPKAFEKEIKRKALIENLSQGPSLTVTKL